DDTCADRRGPSDGARRALRPAVPRGRHRGRRRGLTRRRGDPEGPRVPARRRAPRHRDAGRRRPFRGRCPQEKGSELWDRHPHHLRPRRLPQAGHGDGRFGLHAQGRPSRRPRLRRPPRGAWRAGDGSWVGRLGARREREPAHPAGTGRTGRLGGRGDGGRRRGQAPPLGGHRAQLSLHRHKEARGPQPRGGRPPGRPEGLAL
ncbi:MAG: Two-component transcriptional response regulator, LuxR family, partial [uncultured Rubrobacteraceae bacterium]